MPHVIIEISRDLEAAHDIQALCETLYAALAADPAVPDRSTLRVRAAPVPYGHQGIARQSFAHAELLLLPGRDEATKARLNALILGVLEAAMPEAGALSSRDRELPAATYARRSRAD